MSWHTRDEITIERELGLQAFREGFAVGADGGRRERRTIVEPATHHHWRAGFNAGRCAAAEAELDYRRQLDRAETEVRP